jgi:hypothetical protein
MFRPELAILICFFKKIAVILFSRVTHHKQARKQRGTGTHEKQRNERAWLNKITAIFLKKQLLTPEDGQLRPKHVVILKILKSDKCWEHYKVFKHW